MYAVSIAGESILKYLKDLLGTVSGETRQEGIKDFGKVELGEVPPPSQYVGL